MRLSLWDGSVNDHPDEKYMRHSINISVKIIVECRSNPIKSNNYTYLHESYNQGMIYRLQNLDSSLS